MTSARTFDELFEQKTWHLTLERESDKFWIVCDADSPDSPMIRTASCDTAVRFMAAFCEKTAGATIDVSAQMADAVVEHSWRVAQAADASQVADYHNGNDRIVNRETGETARILPFRRRPLEPIDEVG